MHLQLARLLSSCKLAAALPSTAHLFAYFNPVLFLSPTELLHSYIIIYRDQSCLLPCLTRMRAGALLPSACAQYKATDLRFDDIIRTRGKEAVQEV